MAHTIRSPENAGELQENLIWFMKLESGKRLPNADVRAAMVIRADTHLMGFSGLRLELVRCMETFLNTNVTPLKLRPKEGLAMINGTSVMSGIATNCVYDARVLLVPAMASGPA
jgi:phenylalanine ammonia-lyase